MMRLDESEEDEVLAHEARGGGNAGEREHEDEEKDGGGRAPLVEAVEIVEFVSDKAALAERYDDGESADGRENVGDQVVDDSGETGFVAGDEAKKDVANVRDGGIGEEALDVGL